jgi:hypothetical protein
MADQNFERIENDVREIKEAILGTGLHDGNGLMQRQKRIEKKVYEHEKVLWMLGGVMFFASAIVGLIKLASSINIQL